MILTSVVTDIQLPEENLAEEISICLNYMLYENDGVSCMALKRKISSCTGGSK